MYLLDHEVKKCRGGIRRLCCICVFELKPSWCRCSNYRCLTLLNALCWGAKRSSALAYRAYSSRHLLSWLLALRGALICPATLGPTCCGSQLFSLKLLWKRATCSNSPKVGSEVLRTIYVLELAKSSRLVFQKTISPTCYSCLFTTWRYINLRIKW